jgi:DNA-binding GntR family transcriptional regulator
VSAPRRGSTKAAEIAQALREEILALRLRPGERLRSAPLRERYGVSLSVVREALISLVESGLVTSTPQTGFAVMRLDVDHLLDLTRVRREVEGLALRWSMEADGDGWRRGLAAAAHLLDQTPRASEGDADAARTWRTAHRAFHDALAAGSGSPILLSARENLFSASELYRGWSGADPVGAQRDVRAEHRAIARAALAGQVEVAVELLDRHIGDTTTLLLGSRLID